MTIAGLPESTHGAYPPSYLKRVQSMFPDAKRVLHLFSGSLPPGNYARIDLRADAHAGVVPDVRGDAQSLQFASSGESEGGGIAIGPDWR